MAYTYGAEVTSIEVWPGKLRVGIQVSKVAETRTTVSYSISVIPQLYRYHGFPHHYFDVYVAGTRVKHQSDLHIASTPNYPGDNTWYTSTSDISAYNNSTYVFNKTSVQQTITVSAKLGVNYAYTEPTTGVYVLAVEATHSVNITIPKKKGQAHIKVNGEWKDATPYVNVNGVWKEAVPYVNVNGVWKEGV